MTWIILLIVLDHGGHRAAVEPMTSDWWTCRSTELRVSAGYQDRYRGMKILGASCIRGEVMREASCREARRCA